jgi:hypothetical protein
MLAEINYQNPVLAGSAKVLVYGPGKCVNFSGNSLNLGIAGRVIEFCQHRN